VSVEAITWALRQPIKQSSAKFVLVVLANCASAANNQAHPSVAYLCDATGQNRKTVIENLRRLADGGYVEDTGERRGATKQIIVYRLRIEVQRDGDLLTERHYIYRVTNPATGRYYIGVRTCLGEPASDASYLGSGRWPQHCAFHGIALTKVVLSVYSSRYQAEQAEAGAIAQHIDDPLCMNRSSNNGAEIGTVTNDPEIGTVERVPFSDLDSPAFGSEQSRFSAKQSQKRDTEPSEPSRNRKSNHSAPAALDLSTWPSQPGPTVLADWCAHRKAKRAPISETVLASFGAQLHRAAEMGWTVDECLTECMNRNWQGFKAEWLRDDPPRARSSRGDSYANSSRAGKPSLADQCAADSAARRAGRRSEPSAGDVIDGTSTRVPN
jgi:hypothetical protein